MTLPEAERRPQARSGASKTSPAATLLGRADIAALLALSDERDTWQRRLLAAEIRGYDRGHRDGYRCGYAQAEAGMDRRWHEHADPIARSDPRLLLARRWSLRGEPRTRQTFGQAHPDDYRGDAA
jgi:hypothetical protein